MRTGGGRIDLGILEFASRVWTSDCVDPVERADIQRYTSLLVPPCMMGEHVGASPAHSTHRATSQEMRMAMAFFGHMGVEWNLLKESDEALNKLGEGRRIQEAPRMVRDRHVRCTPISRSGRPGRRHGQAGSFRGVLPVHATDNVPDSPCGADSRARS